MNLTRVLLILAGVTASSQALALSQSKHRALSDDACRGVGLPMDFCDEVGAASYNVDRYEWELLAAHAQPEEGQSHCDAALAVTGRVASLGKELRALLAAPGATKDRASIEAIAKALGRTLHTLQDNCAHSGVSNTQHAWFSLSDSCLDTTLSPDIQPEALKCAKEQSVLALDAFVVAYKAAALKPSSFKMYKEDNEPLGMYFPPRGGVCEFLKGADTWDGVDRRWNNELVVPALGGQFSANLTVDPETPATDLCAGNPDAIALQAAPPVEVAQKTEWCNSIKLYCAGKSDGVDESPPWEEPSPSADPVGANGESDAGCTVRGDAGPSAWAALLGALGAAGLLRRRKR